MKRPSVFSGWVRSSAKHFGAFFAVLCAIHCVGFFVLTVLGATTFAILFDNVVIHGWFAALAAVFVLWDLTAAVGRKPRSLRSFAPNLIMVIGLAMMGISLGAESAHAHEHDREHSVRHPSVSSQPSSLGDPDHGHDHGHSHGHDNDHGQDSAGLPASVSSQQTHHESHLLIHLLFMGGNLAILGGHILHRRDCRCDVHG